MFVPRPLAPVIRSIDSSEIPSAFNLSLKQLMLGVIYFFAQSKDAFPCFVPIKGLEILVVVILLVLCVGKVADTMVVFATLG